MSQETEWSSEVAVKPVEVLHFDSVLDEMIKNKVQVYFVNPEIYRANREKGSPSWQSAIGIKSENEERGEKAINTFNPSI
jgi:hypothetical protein